jgi:DNA-binding NarL/FixJ family response regulator
VAEGAAGTSRRRVVIVDDHAAFADMFQVALEPLDDLECVGSAASLAEAVQVVAETAPDIVVVDLSAEVCANRFGQHKTSATSVAASSAGSLRQIPPAVGKGRRGRMRGPVAPRRAVGIQAAQERGPDRAVLGAADGEPKDSPPPVADGRR